MMDLRQRRDVLLERREARRPVSERIRDRGDAGPDRWGDLPRVSRDALGGAAALALPGAAAGASVLLDPSFGATQVRTTTTSASGAPETTTTSIPLSELLETPVTERTTTSFGPLET